MQNILFISFLITVFIANSIFRKKNFFSNYSGEIHQTLTGKSNVPLSGGIFILLFMFTLLLENYGNFTFFFNFNFFARLSIGHKNISLTKN